MAFTDFTSIAQVQETFDIKYVEEEYIRYDVDIEPSSAFLEEFAFSQQYIDVFASETSRCENVIYPILRMFTKNMLTVFRCGAINLLLTTRNSVVPRLPHFNKINVGQNGPWNPYHCCC